MCGVLGFVLVVNLQWQFRSAGYDHPLHLISIHVKLGGLSRQSDCMTLERRTALSVWQLSAKNIRQRDGTWDRIETSKSGVKCWEGITIGWDTAAKKKGLIGEVHQQRTGLHTPGDFSHSCCYVEKKWQIHFNIFTCNLFFSMLFRWMVVHDCFLLPEFCYSFNFGGDCNPLLINIFIGTTI